MKSKSIHQSPLFCTLDDILPFYPLEGVTPQRLLQLSRQGRFPAYRRLSRQSPAMFQRTSVISFWLKHFWDGWPEHCKALQQRLAVIAEEPRPTKREAVGDKHGK